METRSSKRKKLLINAENDGKNGTKTDRISDLPEAILHQILILLPIKAIAQSGILSKRWRTLWSSFPDLDFTTINPLYPSLSNHESTSHKKFYSPSTSSTINGSMEFINEVLALRDKNSDVRLLRFRAHLSFSHLNGMIRRAIRHNVQELDIEVATEDYFNLPRCVLTSESLRVFKLKSHYPGFRLPPSSIMNGGFQSLHVLSLSLIILYNQSSLLDLFTDSSFPLLKKLNLDACFGLENLCISCRQIQDLALENCFQLRGLDVYGPKMETLRVASCFDAYCDKSSVKINGPRLRRLIWEHNSITEKSCFMNLTCLNEASIGFFLLHNEDASAAKLSSVSNLIAGLSLAHCLTLERKCIEILSNNNRLTVPLHPPFSNLKYLELHTDFNKKNVPGIACLFRSCPTLHTLILRIVNDYKIERRQWNRDMWEVSGSEEEQFWESQTQTLKSFLHHLKVVKIHGFLECENEISLAKFLLKHGRALQEMTLCSGHCNSRDSLRRQKIRSQMMGFSWASSNAKIAFQ